MTEFSSLIHYVEYIGINQCIHFIITSMLNPYVHCSRLCMCSRSLCRWSCRSRGRRGGTHLRCRQQRKRREGWMGCGCGRGRRTALCCTEWLPSKPGQFSIKYIKCNILKVVKHQRCVNTYAVIFLPCEYTSPLRSWSSAWRSCSRSDGRASQRQRWLLQMSVHGIS